MRVMPVYNTASESYKHATTVMIKNHEFLFKHTFFISIENCEIYYIAIFSCDAALAVMHLVVVTLQ